MFRRKVQPISDVILKMLRDTGLETPLQQRRLIEAWDTVTGPVVSRYTEEKFIKNQTLMVKITNPALRADLTMIRTELARKLNDAVGAQVIADIRIF